MRYVIRLVAASLLILPLASSTGLAERCIDDFDVPLKKMFSTNGDSLKLATAAVGTEDGFRELLVDVPGTPVAAFLYWAGETRIGTAPDPSISLVGGALTGKIFVQGEEVGRRNQVFSDELNTGCAGNAGESVMRGAVPLSAFKSGLNRFTINDFNERNDICNGRPANIYRKQYGVGLLVVYSESSLPGNGGLVYSGRGGDPTGSRSCHTPGSCTRDVLTIAGADVASAHPFTRGIDCQDEINSQVSCFQFETLECDTSGQLVIGVAGTQPRSEIISRRLYLASEERTWFTDSMSTDGELIGDGEQLEFNQLIDKNHSFRGRRMSLMQTDVQLTAGSSEACFQLELLAKKPGELAQNVVLFLGALSVDRSCR